jgi:hypothetical protein
MKKWSVIVLVCLGILGATVGAWLQAPSSSRASITSRVPAGALLVLQAKDLGSLLRDWNGSREKATWIESANYQAFSRSKLFLRLKEAYDEFSAAAGAPPDMALLSDVAGSESALGLYDIGKLEFLYVTRLPSAKAMENALWRARGDYEPREAAGTPFYVREKTADDSDKKRVVAFAVRDGYLLLATREDLLAGALTLMAGQAGAASVETDSWFAQATKAAGAAGDLRLVMNLQALAKTPHFRSYWIQDNLDEIKAYSAAVSDLVRSSADLRETRVLLRAQDTAAPAAGSDSALTGLMHIVPDGAGLYRAWAAPSAQDAASLIFEKVIATSGAAALRDRTAPTVGGTPTTAGGEGDLESRIDQEARAPKVTTYDHAALDQLMGREPLRAMLHVEATRPGGDGVFVNRGSVLVIERASDWPAGAAREALRTLIEPVWTKAHLGLRWVDAHAGSQTVSQLEGLETVAVAERGHRLFVASDLALLGAVLDEAAKPANSASRSPSPEVIAPAANPAAAASAVPSVTAPAANPAAASGVYAAGFRHGLERDRFVRVMRFIDHAGLTGADNREPMFFSENLGSLSDTLAVVDQASIVVRDGGATVSQTVTYTLRR